MRTLDIGFDSADAGRWPAELFPDGLAAATSRLRTRLVERLDADGALREPCRSRVLESALALRLMERVANTSASRDRVLDYLRQHRDTSCSIDRVLVTLAVGGAATVEEGFIKSVLRQVPSFVAPRRRVMLEAVMALLGWQPAPTGPWDADDEVWAQPGLHTWAKVQVTAVKVILCAQDGRRQETTDDDVAILWAAQRSGSIWEQHILVHLLVLHALAYLPGHEETVRAGVRTLLAYQRADGGFPFVPDLNTWCTATAAVALAAAGAPQTVLNRIAEQLVSWQRPSGGWSITDGVELTDVDGTSVTLEFLQALGPYCDKKVIDRGLAALEAVRGTDGGFPTYTAGASSEACMTAAAINAFSYRRERYRELLRDARAFLAASQDADGGFPPGWSSSSLHTLFRARLAAGLHTGAAAQVRTMAQRIDRAVVDTQNADGGWGQQPSDPSDVISTSYATVVLCCGRDPRPAARAATWLLDAQREDGSFDSPPDMVGPRPFVYHIPILADIFALLAHGHLTSRLAPSAAGSRTGSAGRCACNSTA
jgi:squalene-hopene/tetraprenyl-beta-curcumene cyclase